ncbi:DEAD/DEAH box helicase [bacterium]|nr:DEAD/DEAH box helicase [bacterium]
MKKYQDMALAKELKQALNDLKFEDTTEIQEKVIPIALEGGDLMACAQTGSGKTAAFCIPMIQQILYSKDKNALILAPTRELAQQICAVVVDLTKYCRHLNTALLVGGADMRRQTNVLRKHPRIVIATPGRLNDHIRRRTIDLRTTAILVLDEGDRMLDMGFAPQLDEILKYLPKERQSSLFTATLPDKIKRLAQRYLNQPTSISVGQTSQPVSSIKQSVLSVTQSAKNDKIVDELNAREGSIIIFMRTKRRTDVVANMLDELGFPVGLIHGGRSQGQRNRALQNFKDGHSRILCATDVAARGIDIPAVEHVINFDLPMMEEDYVHRIGRTARNGAKGEALSFVSPEEHRTWNMLARRYRIEGVALPEIRGAGGASSNGSRDRGGFRNGRSSGGSGGGGGRGYGARRGSSSNGGGNRSFGGRSSSAGGRTSSPAGSRSSDSRGGESRYSDTRGASPARSSESRPYSPRPNAGKTYSNRSAKPAARSGGSSAPARNPQSVTAVKKRKTFSSRRLARNPSA